MPPILPLLVLLFCSPAVFAQALSYQDADTEGQAVGMMNITIFTNRKMLSECRRRFPEHEQEMSGNLNAWEEKERAVLSKAKYFWSEMSKRDAKLAQFPNYAEGVVVRNIENLANAPTDQAAKVVSDYCRKHFTDLASGIWRTRTPRAYRYMDQASSAPSMR